MTRFPRVWMAAIVVVGGASLARGQESFFISAATLPSPGKIVVRENVIYRSFGRDRSGLGRRGYAVTSETSVQVGVVPELSLTVDLPVTDADYRLSPEPGAPAHHGVSEGSESERAASTALEDFPVLAKWRIYRHDFGPLDTLRIAFIGGVQVPAGSEESSDSFDPIVGAAMTSIIGRQGFNLAGSYQLSTGGSDVPLFAGEGNADLLTLGSSYLYRLSPATFSETRTTGTYAVVESISTYETNGDIESLLSPGLMLEAPGFAAELAVQFPIYQRIEHRPQTDFVVALGVRFTW